MVKVHVHILNRRPGEAVHEGDKDYACFKAWAERGDTRNGAVICSFDKAVPAASTQKTVVPFNRSAGKG